MKWKVINNNPEFGDECAEYFDSLEEAEVYREEVLEEIIALHTEEALREFYESQEGQEAVSEMEEEVLNNGLRQEAKEAIDIIEE